MITNDCLCIFPYLSIFICSICSFIYLIHCSLFIYSSIISTLLRFVHSFVYSFIRLLICDATKKKKQFNMRLSFRIIGDEPYILSKVDAIVCVYRCWNIEIVSLNMTYWCTMKNKMSTQLFRILLYKLRIKKEYNIVAILWTEIKWTALLKTAYPTSVSNFLKWRQYIRIKEAEIAQIFPAIKNWYESMERENISFQWIL